MKLNQKGTLSTTMLIAIGMIIAAGLGYLIFSSGPGSSSTNTTTSTQYVACDLLSASEVTTITGKAFTALPAQPGGLGLSVCSYTSDTDNTMVVLTTNSKDNADRAQEVFDLNKASAEANTSVPFQEVSGVGEGAFFTGDPANILEFKKNNATVTVAAKGKFGNNLQVATDIAQTVASGM